MRILIFFFLLFSFQAFSQGPVDRIELGFQTTKRGIVWVRPGLPTHEPVWRVARDTNAILWQNLTTGIRYDWSYATGEWNRADVISQTLPPIESITSGLATINNTTSDWVNDDGILHFYDNAIGAWVPHQISYQSLAPADVAAGVSNAAAVYTTTLWQDADDFLVRYWDGDSWELMGGNTDLTFSGASSPVTLNSSTGTDVTFTAGTGISLAATGTNTTITNTGVIGSGLSPHLAIWSASNTITYNGAFQYLLGADDYRIIINGARNDRFGKSFQINSSTAVENLGVTDDGSTNIRGVFYQGKTPATYYGFTQGQINIFSKFSMYETGLAYVDAVTDKFRFLTFVEPSQDYLKFRSVYGVGNGIGGTAGDTYTDLFVVKADGKFGILNTSPQQTFHVTGTARITGSDGTATTVMGRDGDGDISALSLSGMSISGGTLTATDGSVTNEAWTIDADDADTEVISNQTVKFQGGGIVVTDYIPGTDILTITGTEVDGSTTNELQTIANTSNSTSHTATLSSSGGSLQLIEGSGVLLTTGGTGLNGTVTIEAIDPSTTNEIQTLSASGAGPTSYNIDLTSSGTSVTLAEGSGIDLTRSTNTITIASTGITSATGYINGGNSFGGAATIGLNDNFDWAFETNGTTRGWIDNGGTYTIGSAILTTAALNISGLQNNIGMHVAGGSGLTGPVFLQTRGTGSGSDCTVLDAQHFFTSGNVVALLQNTSTTGTGGVEIAANAKTATGDPRLHLEIDGTTDWSIGIDNDDVDNLKLHKFASPSDNNGVGTLEFGYDGTSLGLALNKVGIGTSANSHYAIDALGKFRADQFVNNSAGTVVTGTYALGTAAGTSPTLSGSSEFWGNGGRLIFTSGTSPTTNGVICTVTLGAEYTFAECAPIMQGRTTNTGGFDYVGTFNSGTRVITYTLIGTLAASTNYEFNLIISGRN